MDINDIPDKFKNMSISEMNNALDHPDQYGITVMEMMQLGSVMAEAINNVNGLDKAKAENTALKARCLKAELENKRLKEAISLFTNNVASDMGWSIE